MTAPLPRPFPLAPLLDLVTGSQLHRADRFGLHPRQWLRFVHHGTLTVDQADRLATRIGLHPCEVWGDLWWEHADTEAAAS